jgi:hypothetical protein
MLPKVNQTDIMTMERYYLVGAGAASGELLEYIKVSAPMR